MNISLAYTFWFKLAWISISMVELPLCPVAILEYLASFYMPGAVKGMSSKDFFFVHFPFLLTLFGPGGGHYGTPYHESVCRCCMVRAMLSKLPDFVPFHISQVLETQF